MARVLIACEFSGVVRDAFIERGHDAVSCDLLPTHRPGPHIQGDVRDIIDDGWDMMIAHPPCTRLCIMGLCRLYEGDNFSEIKPAAEFFLSLLNADIPNVAVENPRMHRHAKTLIGPSDFCVQPWNFAEPYKKLTCFWLRNLPPLVPEITDRPAHVQETVNTLHGNPQAPRKIPRNLRRSWTFSGIAHAMAKQWGDLL